MVNCSGTTAKIGGRTYAVGGDGMMTLVEAKEQESETHDAPEAGGVDALPRGVKQKWVDAAKKAGYDSQAIFGGKRWYHFRQARPSGCLIYGRHEHIVVEALNATDANNRAESVAGIYFDGNAKGVDASFDRWDRVTEDDGESYPHVSSERILDGYDEKEIILISYPKDLASTGGD